jgi:hypothetical protein
MAKPQVNVKPQRLSETGLITGVVRLAFQSLMEPRVTKNDDGTLGEPKYPAVLLIDPNDTELLTMMKDCMKNAAVKYFGEGKVPTGMRNPLRDGAEKAQEWPFYAGHLFINTSTKNKPGLVNQANKPITDPDEIYSGCWVRVELNAFAYAQKGNKGVSFGLNNVQKLGDDERFGGRRPAEQVFAPVVDAANPFAKTDTAAADDMFA